VAFTLPSSLGTQHCTRLVSESIAIKCSVRTSPSDTIQAENPRCVGIGELAGGVKCSFNERGEKGGVASSDGPLRKAGMSHTVVKAHNIKPHTDNGGPASFAVTRSV